MSANSDGKPNGWSIVEEYSYERAVAQIESHQYFDEALAPIVYALHCNPLGFQSVPGFEHIRIAKTKLRIFGPEIIPSYRVWFSASEASMTVYLRWVEMASPEEMGFWGDKTPF